MDLNQSPVLLWFVWGTFEFRNIVLPKALEDKIWVFSTQNLRGNAYAEYTFMLNFTLLKITQKIEV